MTVCEAAAYYKMHGLTLWDQMNEMHKKYGYYKEKQMSIGSSSFPINEMKVVTSEGDKYIATTDQTVPSGGTTGQVLMKNSDTDYDFGWASLADYDEVSF